MRASFVVSAVALVTLVGGPASAESLRMAPAAKAELTRSIAADRSAHPEAFARVAALRGRVVELDAHKRGPLPAVAPLFRKAAPEDFFALAELGAYGPPDAASLSLSAVRALRAGALEALGRIGDARALPVLRAVLEGDDDDMVVQGAAAEGLGRLASAESLAVLTRALGGTKPQRIAALRGLAVSHRASAAQELARFAQLPADAEMRLATLRALGEAGAAWAVTAPNARAAADAATVRSTAARALVSALLREQGELETEAADALLLVAAPETAELLRAALPGQPAEKRAAVEYVLRRL